MDWVHLHLALNHVPVLGTVFLFLLLCVGALRGSDELKRTSLAGFALLTLVSIPTKFTGDFAYEAVSEAAWLEVDRVEAHEQAADQATTAIFALGLASGIAWYRARRRNVTRGNLIVTLILALLTCCLMGRAAYLGGQLRHTEIRPQHEASASSPHLLALTSTTNIRV